MADQESAWDQTLRILTVGRDETKADQYHHPYEPTPYCVLERLASSGLIKNDHTVLDYGCGKGRVGFYLSYRTHATVIGIEYDERIYDQAIANQQTVLPKTKTEFILSKAEEYPVASQVSRCYFFNPFSVEILQKVMAQIVASYYEYPRDIFLFFYYPADEYIAYLMTVDELEFYDEIPCDDLFQGKDSRERIMIFYLPDYRE